MMPEAPGTWNHAHTKQPKEVVMPKVEISNSKGLVQSSGEGMHIIGGTLSDSVGIHTYQELVTIPAAGLAVAADTQGTGVGLSKKLPANSHILHSSMTAVQLATAGATCLLNLKLDTVVQAHAANVLGAELLAADVQLGTGGSVGSSAGGNAVPVGSDNVINISHAGVSNVTAGDAKVLVTIVYAGKGEPVAV